MKKIMLFMLLGLVATTSLSGKRDKVQADEKNETLETVEITEESPMEVIENVDVEETEVAEEVIVPTLEELLHHTWELSTDDTFEYDTWTEDVNESLLACAEEYVIDSYEYDENGNMVVYWHTDYMTARLVIFADREYKYIEANYFVDEDNDYTGDTLYFRR